jgi:hypothetical protein
MILGLGEPGIGATVVGRIAVDPEVPMGTRALVPVRPTGLIALALLLCAGSPAYASDKYPPGPPYRNCPDTLRIYDIQQPDTLLAPCHPRNFSPASGDTVLGIKGIITAFDAKPAAFAFYIQDGQGGPYSGVQVFTGAYNWSAFPYNLAIGDLVAVYGTVQEFPFTDGCTEIEGPDVIQRTNDIIIRKINSGNPLPPFRIVSTTQLNWIPVSPGNEGERWEGCLVRVRGPLRVGRTSAQGGLPTLPFNSFLVVRVTSPAESTLIDGNSLTTFAPPAVGAVIDSIQGIVTQNTTSGVNSYRILLRDGDDVFGPFATSLTDAYPIDDSFTGSPIGPEPLGTSNTRVRLEFGRRVDVATGEDERNYSLASGVDGSTVDHATVEGGGGRAVLLDITSVRRDGDIETVTAGGIGSEVCPACPMASQSRMFINGVLDVKQVQAADPESLGVCTDRSRFAGVGLAAGLRITVHGVGVGPFGPLQYMEDADGADRSGIAVFGPISPIVVGSQYLVAGQIQEFGGETEIANNVYVRDLGTVGAPAPRIGKSIAVLKDTTCDAAQRIENGEDLEAMLVKVKNVRVTQRRSVGQSFFTAGPCCTFQDTILISNLNTVLDGYTPPDSGSIVDVTGILHFANGTFRLCPRSGSDIVIHGLEPPPPLPMRFDFTPGTLSLTSRGKWVTGYLEPTPPRAAAGIDVTSIRLNGTVPVDTTASTAVGDHDGNGVPDLMVKFSRTAVELTVSAGDSVAITVTGMLGPDSFSGTDTIHVRRGKVSAPLAGSHFAGGSVARIRWETPDGVKVQSVGLLLSFDGGRTWSPIAGGRPNTGNFDWTVPNAPTDKARLALLAESGDGPGAIDGGVVGLSETFTIEAVVGVADPSPAPLALTIRGAAPNPTVDGRLRVEFALRDGSPAKLELTDVAGRALASKQVGMMGPGPHVLDLSAGRALPPGIYFLRLTQGVREARARVAVLR